jgi:two-component system, NtrC family, sensor kinase
VGKLLEEPLVLRWQNRMWRYRIALFTGITLVGAIGAWYAIASSILLGSFAQVEEQSVQQDVRRTLSTTTYELSGLMRSVRDYAVWDETYHFAEGNRPNYLGEAVTAGTFYDNRIHFMAILNTSGELIYGGLYDSTQEKFLPLPAKLYNQLSENLPLVKKAALGQESSGLLVVADKLMLIACNPIRHSDETGPIKSVMIFGRYLDTDKIAELNQVTNLAIEVYPANARQLPTDLKAAAAHLSNQHPILVQPISPISIAGYTRIKDIYDQPSIFLKITTSRAIYQQGQLSARYLAGSLVVVGGVSSVVIGLLLRKLVRNLRERDRLEQSLHQETILRKSEEKYREKAEELEQALHKLQQTQAQLVQSEKMSSLGQLVAGIAHEINNPVSFIYGNLKPLAIAIQDLFHLADLYKKHYPSPAIEIRVKEKTIELPFLKDDLPRLLNSMKNGAERIQQIVLSLRNFSRLDESSMKFVNIHEGIDNTLFILQSRLKPQGDFPGIEVIKEYGDLPLVECYAGQLNQVFMNILVNAIDALEETHDSAQIHIQTRMLSPTLVMIRIRDNGMGMTEAVQHKLFDPFFTTKPVGQGTGLGLAISYKVVVEKHQGVLACHSMPGQGATFSIQIPVEQVQER